VAQRQVVKDHIRQSILDAAATLLSSQGDSAIMSELADAAGVGRATLYRYFSTREELMTALAHAAIDDISTRLGAADLEHVPVPEAIARILRAILAGGAKFEFIRAQHEFIDKEDVDRRIGEPIRAVIRRGMQDGTLRSDVPLEVLSNLFGGMIFGAARSLPFLENGVERASAIATETLLKGLGPSAQ
jgi:TetR/AcrR family transcriptional regulator, mexCD-oprJ operon repressor